MRQGITVRWACGVFGLVLSACGLAAGDTAYEVEWIRQLGTSGTDYGHGVAVDSAGNPFITGYTVGNLGGVNAGDNDAFLTKYNSDGNLLWMQQLGTSSDDASYSVAVDAAGNAFICGATEGNLDGINAGSHDAFLAKYNSDGNLLWTQQLGTSSADHAASVAVDGAGNAFISGSTGGDLGGTNAGGDDAFLTKYNSDGNLQWTQQLGTSTIDWALSVAVDGAGNAFISGFTAWNLAGTNAGYEDAFLAKYNSDGNLQWTRQMGTSSTDYSFSVAVDNAGNAFISGSTEGDLDGVNAGYWDAFVTKYDTDGNVVWTRQLGSPSLDFSSSVAVDGSGDVFIVGDTEGDLGGVNAGGRDVFLAKYDSAGNLLWTEQLGTSSGESTWCVDVDGTGNVYISGYTTGSLGGTNAGKGDAFLIKYEVPEPASLLLLAMGAMAFLRRRQKARGAG